MPWPDLTTGERNSLWGHVLIGALTDYGKLHICVSPGSRSTPLALAAAASEHATTHVHFDERGAAYYALGMAKATGNPTVLICTSGTAAVNYFPAIVEASQDCIPLIVLTADRPAELRGSGANQTIDQVNLYGNYVRFHADLPCPDGADLPDDGPIDDACKAAMELPRGPVHLNCQFREPFLPEVLYDDYASGRPALVRSPESAVTVPKDVATAVTESRQGIVVLGAAANATDAEASIAIAKNLRWPVIADIQFGLGLNDVLPQFVSCHGLFLRSPSLAQSLYPDVVLQIGGRVTSKYLQSWLGSDERTQWIQVHANDKPINPHRREVLHIPHRASRIVNSFNTIDSEPDDVWCEICQQTGLAVQSVIDAFLDDREVLTEAHVANAIAEGIPADHALFAGNSMTIRMLDIFAARRSTWSPVVANRGASGIDGCIATAAGYAQASGRPITAVIGDLAALHDLNSLSLWAKCPPGSVLVIINNDGGGIFHLLPGIGENPAFEEFFATPHGKNFEDAAEMFGLDFRRADSSDSLANYYSLAQDSDSQVVLEVTIDRDVATRRVQELFTEIQGDYLRP